MAICERKECGNMLYGKYQKRFCCRSCAAKTKAPTKWTEDRKETQSNKFVGEGNPNFGKKWSEEQRVTQSNLVQEKLGLISESERKKLFGKSNRGKVRSKEFLERWHSTQRDPNYIRPPITEEIRAKIRRKSSEKFTPEFKKEQRVRMEAIGKWVPRTEENAYRFYRKQSNWIRKMWDVVRLPEDFYTVGIFNAINNPKGYIRDHCYSRRAGYTDGVFPELLRHPANCQIITHSDNVRKGRKSILDISQLFENIEHYNGEWEEKDLCLARILLYNSGMRWNINDE